MLDTLSRRRLQLVNAVSSSIFRSLGANSYLLVFLVSLYCIVSKLPGVTRPHAAFETSQLLATPVTGAGRRKTLRLTTLGWTARQTIIQKTRIHEPIPSYLQRSHVRLNYRIPGEIIKDRRPDSSTRTRSIRVLEMTLDLCQKAKNTRWTT